jgi:hypothetical protein
LGAVLKLVSAKEGKNIDDLFNTVGEMVLKGRSTGQNAPLGTKVSSKKAAKKKGCC